MMIHQRGHEKTAGAVLQSLQTEISALRLIPGDPPASKQPSMPCNDMIQTPLQTPWQQKWLRMDCVHPSIQSLADEVQDYCGRWFRNEPSKSLLVIAGPPGTGKTHVARAVSRFASALATLAWESGYWGKDNIPNYFFMSWPVASGQFMGKQFGLTEDAIHHSLTILDDIGAENDPFNIAKDQLCQILSARQSKFTVVTTNIMPEHWEEKFDARIADRLLRNSVVKILTCPSYSTR